MKHWLMLMAAVGLMMTILATPGVQAASKTLYVGTCKGSSPYITIQSAVDAVNDTGFTIYVCPGTYTESVSVQNKEKLTIRNYPVKNQPAPLIDGGYIDVIDSRKVEIRGLRISNASSAIVASNSPETEVRDTVITNVSFQGILFRESDKSKAQQNSISGTTSTLFAIHVGSSNNVTIKQNIITSVRSGIYGSSDEKLKIESNTVTNVGDNAILLAGVTRATIKKNTISFANHGILLSGVTTSTISENTAKNNRTTGVMLNEGSANNTIKKNLLQGNGTDASDDTSGSKTAGTANSWTNNTCATSTPGDLCGSTTTAGSAPPTP